MENSTKKVELNTQSLTRFDPFDQQIQSLLANYSDYTIPSPAKKEDVIKLRADISVVAKCRTSIENERKTIVSNIMQFKKDLNNHAKGLTDRILPLELEMKKELKRVEDEKKAELERIERERLIKLNQRIDRLLLAGYMFNGQQYQVGSLLVDKDDIEGATEDLVEDWVIRGEKEANRIKELLMAAERLEKERKDFKRAQREQEERERQLKIKEEQAKRDQEALDARMLEIAKISESDKVVHPKAFPVKEDPKEEASPMEFLEDNGDFSVEVDENLPDQATKMDPDRLDSHRPAGYVMGFDACRALMIEFIENADKLTRSIIIEKLRDLEV